MKTIIFDVDGVLADFVAGVSKLVCPESPITTVSNPSMYWDFRDIWSPEAADRAWSTIKNDPDWWANLPPMVERDVFDRIERLHWDHHVLFVTARVSDFNVQAQTRCWLIGMGIDDPAVVVTNKKGDIARAVNADYHIDDKPENAACVHWMADMKPCRSYHLDHYNGRRSAWLPRNVRRVTSVIEFIQDIEDGK